MFIYFLEQVWNYQGFYGWVNLGEVTHEVQHCYADAWHDTGYKHSNMYPYSHMEEGNDYIDF